MYHGSIFSMKYHKKFVSYFTKKRLIKANTTFDVLEMSDRVIADENDLEKILLKEPDYIGFEKALDYYRKKSLIYIEESINKIIEKLKTDDNQN